MLRLTRYHTMRSACEPGTETRARGIVTEALRPFGTSIFTEMTVLPIGVAGGHGICHGLSDSYYRQLLQDYTRKRNWLSDALSDMGFKVYPCDGTYYLLADITTLGFDAVQMDIVWHDRHANHAHAWDLAAAAKASDVDLVVFPEMFSTGFSMDTDVIAEAKDGSTPTLLRSMARELNIKDRKPHFFK